MIPPRRTRVPSRKTASKRWDPLSGRNDRLPLTRVVERSAARLCGEAVPTLYAPALHYGAALTAAHAVAKTMFAFPTPIVGLICTFHSRSLT